MVRRSNSKEDLVSDFIAVSVSGWFVIATNIQGMMAQSYSTDMQPVRTKMALLGIKGSLFLQYLCLTRFGITVTTHVPLFYNCTITCGKKHY